MSNQGTNKRLTRPRALGVLLCYNDADILGDTIEALLENEHSLIVWDHGSDDGTADVLNRYQSHFVERKFIPRDFDFYQLYQAMSKNLLDFYVSKYDWISWPDQDEILEGPIRGKTYYRSIEEVYHSNFDWIQFNNFNYWFTEKDDTTVVSPVRRIRHYSLFPDCAPRIRSWRAAATNIRQFNHNPPSGVKFPTHFNLRHYPMRSKELMDRRLDKDRSNLERGESNFHYNNMKKVRENLFLKSSQLHFDNGKSELNHSVIFNWRRLYGYGKGMIADFHKEDKMNTSYTMTWTGERFTPGSITGQLEPAHWHRYAFARDLVIGKDVLDIASGEGYGSAYLSEHANSVKGVDISVEAINFAQKKYVKSNLEFRVGSCDKIPIPDQSVDTVVSFETLEHHDQHEEMMCEIKRVLRPAGLLIISSPDRKNYTDIPGTKNQHHLKELYQKEFEELLRRHFKNYRILGQRVVTGSLIADESPVAIGQLSGIHYVENESGPIRESWIGTSLFHIALASDDCLPNRIWSLLESNWLQRSYNSLEQQVSDLTQQLLEVQNAKSQISALNQELQNVYNSKSWRITSPIRLFMRKIRQLLD